MKTKAGNKKQIDEKKKDDLPGYPLYPSGEDMYNNLKEETGLDPENISRKREPVYKNLNGLNEKNFKDDKSGGDLDIPGSELDEQEENAGNEDEENNFYSLGGDDHNNLEEDENEVL